MYFAFALVNGGLTGWTAWSACTKTCHTNTVSIRERYCTNPPPLARGKDCVGQRMQARACASSKCPGNNELQNVTIDKQTSKHRQINKQTNKQTDRQTDSTD